MPTIHTFTALFDRREDAEAVQASLTRLGIVDLDHGVHGPDAEGLDREEYSSFEKPGLWGKSKAKAAFLPDEDRHLHEEHLRRGGFMLQVNVDDTEAARVHEVLEGSNALDVEERERDYKASGYAAPVAAAAPALARTQEHGTVEGEGAIPIVEERLAVGKREVERGGVRVRSYVVETPVQEQVTLREEHVDIARRPVNERVADTAGLFENRSFAVSETAEEAVVAKDVVVTEELVVRKDVDQRTETINDTVRHTEVDVDRLEGDTTRPVTPPR